MIGSFVMSVVVAEVASAFGVDEITSSVGIEGADFSAVSMASVGNGL